jgi:hypothetical protein
MRMGRCKQTQKSNAAAAVAILLLVLLAAATAAGGAGIISLRVYDQVEIEADQIPLGKIARIDGDDAGFVRELEAVVIGRSPCRGKACRWTARPSSCVLNRAALDVPGSSCRSPEVQVRRGAVEVAASASSRS